MREIQLILIPKEEGYKSRNMTFSDALDFFKISKDELNRLISNGEEINGWFVDEALIYDNKL